MARFTPSERPGAQAARLGGVGWIGWVLRKASFFYIVDRRKSRGHWKYHGLHPFLILYSLRFIFRFRSSVHALAYKTSRNRFPIGWEVTTYCSFVSGFVTGVDFVSSSHLFSYCLLCLLCGPTSSSSYRRSYILPRQPPFPSLPPVSRFAFSTVSSLSHPHGFTSTHRLSPQVNIVHDVVSNPLSVIRHGL